MAAYASLTQYRDELSLLPGSYVDDVQVRHPGWIAKQLEVWSAYIDSRLAKRYDAPFASPPPIAVQGWLARLMDPRVFLKRGVDSTDAQYDSIAKSGADALTELAEAADGKDGRFDLPLRSDVTTSGIKRPAPMGYAEASPYEWSVVQRERAGG